MLGELMVEVAEDRDPTSGAKRFYEKYKDVLSD